MLWWLKNPPPTMKSKSTVPRGCQKLTSSSEPSVERQENQSLSVMAMTGVFSGERTPKKAVRFSLPKSRRVP
jgi:hypothetical protein